MAQKSTGYPPYMRVFQAILYPIIFAAFASAVAGQLATYFDSFDFLIANNGVILGTIGLSAYILGSRWYPAAELGLRGGRPLFSGFGFAFLGWIGFLVAYFAFIPAESVASGRLGITYLFLLIFEAICVQLWTFGLLFRALNERLSPLAAAIFSGLVFGFAGFLLFQESLPTRLTIIYFVVLGLFYAIIRLRSGSWIGIAIAQSLQSLTTWNLLIPESPIEGLPYLYGISILVYLLVGWRLFPKTTDDFRV